MKISTSKADLRFASAVLLSATVLAVIVTTQEIAERLWSPEASGAILSAQFNSSVAVLLALSAFWLSRREAKSRIHDKRRAMTISAPAAILIVLAIADAKQSYFGLWTGFGPRAAVLVSLVVILFFALDSRGVILLFQARQFRFVRLAISASIIMISLPSLLQHENGLSNFGDTTYHVLDELLAPQLGAYPYSNYSPQYGAELGLLLFPLRYVPISGENMMTLIIVLCNLMILLIPILISAILHRLRPQISHLSLIVAFVLLYVMCGSSNSPHIVQEFAHFQRYVPVLLALWALVNALLAPSGHKRVGWSLGAGIALGLLVLNGLAFGLTLAATTIFWLGIGALKKAVDPASFATTLISSIVTILGYLIVVWSIAGAPSLLSYLGLIADPLIIYQFVPLRLIGAHLLLMSLAVFGVATGIRTLRPTPADQPDSQQIADLLAGILGGWLLILLVKWLQSPIPEGLHFYLVPSFLIAGLLVSDRKFISGRPPDVKGRLAFTSTLLVALLPIAAAFSSPNTKDDLKRITGRHAGSTDWSSTPGRVSDGWSEPALEKSKSNFISVSRDLSIQLSQEGSTVGYFGFLGHTVELLTGVNNYLGIPAPESLRFGRNQELLACRPLSDSPPDYLIVHLSDFPCAGFVRDDSRSIPGFDIYRKND